MLSTGKQEEEREDEPNDRRLRGLVSTDVARGAQARGVVGGDTGDRRPIPPGAGGRRMRAADEGTARRRG